MHTKKLTGRHNLIQPRFDAACSVMCTDYAVHVYMYVDRDRTTLTECFNPNLQTSNPYICIPVGAYDRPTLKTISDPANGFLLCDGPCERSVLFCGLSLCPSLSLSVSLSWMDRTGPKSLGPLLRSLCHQYCGRPPHTP